MREESIRNFLLSMLIINFRFMGEMREGDGYKTGTSLLS